MSFILVHILWCVSQETSDCMAVQ